MAIPNNYTDLAVGIATKKISNEDLIAFCLLHSHADEDETNSCEICSEIYESDGKLIFNFIVSNLGDTLSQELIEFLFEKAETYHSVFNAYEQYWWIKSELCLLPNSPISLLSQAYDWVDCFANQGDLWVHAEWETYYNRLSKHPLCRDEDREKFRATVHGRMENCTCPLPATCEMCIGHHG